MKESAEVEYRKAFKRIIEGKAIRIDKTASPTLANIAREAGKDPSALKKSRYPGFIGEVESFNQVASSVREEADRSLTAQLKSARQENKRLREDYELLSIERDQCHSRVLNLQQAIVELSFEIERRSNISILDQHARQKMMKDAGKDKA
jgi:hypothetical protein